MDCTKRHQDTVAIVTGGAQGVGHAIASRLADEGCTKLMLTGRSVEKGKSAVAAFKDRGVDAKFVSLDLQDPAGCLALVEETVSQLGDATALVNAAALGARGAITVPVTNLVLDPSERTSPYRPHPGRQNLAPGLVLLAMAGDVAGLSPAVSAYLLLAAGAAFMDRVAEAFIGRAALRAEILMLAGSSLLAGVGLMMVGAARLDAPWSEVSGLHVALMGGLGLGVMAVFCIAGLLHSGRSLSVPGLARLGAVIMVLSVALRVLPDLGVDLPGPLHSVAALTWGAGLLLWLWAYWPFLSVVEAGTGSVSDASFRPTEQGTLPGVSDKAAE